MVVPFITRSFFLNLLHNKYIMTPLRLPGGFSFFLSVGTGHFLSTLTNKSNFLGTPGLNHRPVRLKLTERTLFTSASDLQAYYKYHRYCW
jgi:hypothetical protein